MLYRYLVDVQRFINASIELYPLFRIYNLFVGYKPIFIIKITIHTIIKGATSCDDEDKETLEWTVGEIIKED